MATKPRKAKADKVNNELLSAFKFCKLVLKDEGTTFETNSLMANRMLTASNGIVSAGHPIKEDMIACPHTELMIKALSKCGENLSISQMDVGRLSLKSDKFKVIVPCVDPLTMKLYMPDDCLAECNEKFVEALSAVESLASDKEDRVVTASILMRKGSLVTTDGTMLLESWHGLDLPTDIAIPKQIVKPLKNCDKKLVGIGCSHNSVTFWFEDGAWLKTQLYSDKWPNIDPIINVSVNPLNLPGALPEAFDAVSPFSEDELVHFGNEILRSHKGEALGAQHDCPGLPSGVIMKIKQLKLMLQHAKTVDWFVETNRIVFFGDNIRGCIMHMKQ